ncbi:3-deoxy-D-manno-octulosonic acid transferase [Bermanella marisrubri]|nr:lipid IV(A) 3-deoxy-D-manno-octulosonic acid transferase [Bermanella marisrubri]QIZ85477.1 3-deoxy-D-manno-octulosonic acid transferase [Bermanella marisrubri]
MARFFYTALFILILPAILVRLWLRGRQAPAYRQRWLERFGLVSLGSNAQHGIWFHTVSVGEFIAATPVIKAVMDRYPDLPIVITTTTPTGSEQVQSRFADVMGKRVFHCYLPYDIPLLLGAFLKRLKPRQLVILETELWPNLLHCAKSKNCNVLVVNARLSEKSAKGYSKFPNLTRQMLNNIDRLAVQNDKDAQRFKQLGMPAEKMHVTGSIKFDLDVDMSIIEQGEQLRAQWGETRPVICVASTHQGEDEIALDAFVQLKKKLLDPLLILVPRHPERFNNVAESINNRELNLQRRTQGMAGLETHVMLVDTMGELLLFLAASDVCVMGGSFVENGGHNPLEPAALSVPVIMGPSQFNFAVICEQLQAAGGLQTVSEQDLPQQLLSLLESKQLRLDMGKQAMAVVEANKGAKQEVLALIQEQFNGEG